MTTVTTLGINGMTCGSCVEGITSDITQVRGVENVLVQLRSGATSSVTVTSDDPLDEAELRGAINESGYQLASFAVQENAEAAQSAEHAASREAQRLFGGGAATATLPLVAADAAASADGGCCGGGCCS
ncbi:heavy-metal-associated domain-containing protein [Paraoerskovia marina]|uniref:heavy-metal-associated domain-containing protein n=1 Tax=Paraoerskovia marina TaxID=545619 RepID=UPI0009DE5F5B|nr:heavy metal-associated domain-containing protein [Paraoerskovia marina]